MKLELIYTSCFVLPAIYFRKQTALHGLLVHIAWLQLRLTFEI